MLEFGRDVCGQRCDTVSPQLRGAVGVYATYRVTNVARQLGGIRRDAAKRGFSASQTGCAGWLREAAGGGVASMGAAATAGGVSGEAAPPRCISSPPTRRIALVLLLLCMFSASRGPLPCGVVPCRPQQLSLVVCVICLSTHRPVSSAWLRLSYDMSFAVVLPFLFVGRVPTCRRQGQLFFFLPCASRR